MARVEDLNPDEFSYSQRKIYDEIAGPRGGVVRGPFAIWMRRPDLADLANRLGSRLRAPKGLDKRLFEMMVLMIAQHWGAQYEWFAHEKHARSAGLAEATIEAIRLGRRPDLEREDERAVYDAISELIEKRSVSQPSYDRLVAAFGLDTVIELVSAAGFYTMVAMMLVAFEAPVPGGARPLP